MAETATLDMVYEKLEHLQKKIDEIETLLLLPEEKLSDEEHTEFNAIRKEMLAQGGVTLAELDKKRQAR